MRRLHWSTQNQLRQSFALSDLNIVRHILAGGDVRQALVHFPQHVQDDADMGGFVNLREDNLVHPHVAETVDRQLQAFGAGRWLERTRWTSSGSAAFRSDFSSLSFSVSLGLRPAVSISRKSTVAPSACTASRRSSTPFTTRKRRADDVGISLELIDGGDAVGIERNQADAMLFAELEIGRQLGEGGRFADAGRADQGDDMRAGCFGANDRAGGGQ